MNESWKSNGSTTRSIENDIFYLRYTGEFNMEFAKINAYRDFFYKKLSLFSVSLVIRNIYILKGNCSTFLIKHVR